MENAINAGHARDGNGLLFGLVNGWRRQVRMNRAIKRLETLDDDLLRDMGMTRGSIRDSVRNGRR